MNLKGNYWFLILFALLFAACSPKVRTSKKDTAKQKEKEKLEEKKPVKKFSQANVSLLVPFKLDELNLKTATKADVEKFAMPIDFYQGFKLGLDSAASSGLNFKLNVFDTQDDNAHISLLYKNESFKQSNLIIGPVFPAGLKYISNYSKENNATIVSPLAATNPTEFNNPNLVSIVNNIELHGQRIASYISKKFNPANTIVVIINPKKTDDEAFAAPVRDYLKAGGKFIVQEYASAYTFETKMQKGKQYAIVITSADRAFVLPTIDKLYKLKNLASGGYVINLFGHPNWVKQNYPTDKIQALNTIISSSYKIDYKNAAVVSFIKKYRYRYGFEPGEYAFKGFDIGYYFGKLLSNHGEDYREYLTKDKYKGLHNTFSFIYDEKLGYINTSLMLLKYKNFALEIVD
ncbi:amino acid ABC transporter substrate-binding protein [Agrobacterium tumefaciens]|nr:amino acid ABC transporter substrate-binding protein [Agrobacterium tumefaciens]NTE24881.1 amino acid ABC transporter substrate-binding protein [Agrobacterium tumefaciens]